MDSIESLRRMMLIRAFETALTKRPDHGFQLLSSGEEAVAVGLSAALTGKDQLLNTADDQVVPLSTFTREILIRDVTGEQGQLRSIIVTVKFRNGTTTRTYTLTTYISSYS